MSRLEPTDELKFISWFKNEFVFENDEHQVHFTPNYRSDINPIITLESIIKTSATIKPNTRKGARK